MEKKEKDDLFIRHDQHEAKMKEIEESIPILTRSELEKTPCACQCGHDDGEIVLGYCKYHHHGTDHIHVYYNKKTSILKVVCNACRFKHAGIVGYGRVLYRVQINDGSTDQKKMARIYLGEVDNPPRGEKDES